MKMKMQVKTTLNVMLNAFLELGKLTLSLKYTPTQKCMQYHLNWSYWKFSLDFNAILTVENVFYIQTRVNSFFSLFKNNPPEKKGKLLFMTLIKGEISLQNVIHKVLLV